MGHFADLVDKGDEAPTAGLLLVLHWILEEWQSPGLHEDVDFEAEAGYVLRNASRGGEFGLIATPLPSRRKLDAILVGWRDRICGDKDQPSKTPQQQVEAALRFLESQQSHDGSGALSSFLQKYLRPSTSWDIVSFVSHLPFAP